MSSNQKKAAAVSKCDIKAKTQPHFTLLAKDNFTTLLLRDWIYMAKQTGAKADKINDAERILADIEEWRRQNPMECKNPD